MQTFAGKVEAEITHPLMEICNLLNEAQNHEAFAYFINIVSMLADPEDEVQVLAAVIELSRCAFLGFHYDAEVQAKITNLLDDAIAMAHTMSAGPSAGSAH